MAAPPRRSPSQSFPPQSFPSDGAPSETSPPPEGSGDKHRLPDYADRVLAAVEQIPPGRVLTYGDIAGLLGDGGPRQVGRVLALYGAVVPWWRVVRADGRPLPGHELRALREYRAEGTPLRDAAGEPRLDMRRARWDGSD